MARETDYDRGFREGVETGLQFGGITKTIERWRIKRALTKKTAAEQKRTLKALLKEGEEEGEKKENAEPNLKPGEKAWYVYFTLDGREPETIGEAVSARELIWARSASEAKQQAVKKRKRKLRDIISVQRAPAVANPQGNFRIPPKQARETWITYHDRLAELAYIARREGDGAASKALQHYAGELARKHKGIRGPRRARRLLKGPGTYPWEQCIDDQKRRGARDPKAVCGRIRADSRKRYPHYWKERMKGEEGKKGKKKRNPDKRSGSIMRSFMKL